MSCGQTPRSAGSGSFRSRSQRKSTPMRPSLLSLILLLAPALASPAAQTAASTKSGQVTTAKRGDSRTLNETFLSIKRQMKFSGSSHDVSRADKGYNWHRTTSYSNLELNNCQLAINKASVSNDRHREVIYTIPLWDLSSVTYQVDEGSKQFKYTPTVPALFFRSRTKSMHWGRPRSYVATDLIEIEFGRDPSFGKEKIVQLGDAFQHLGSLCASQKPQVPASKSSKSFPLN